MTYRSTARSTGQRSHFDHWQLTVDRPVDRKEQRALLSGTVDRPVDRPECLPDVHRVVHVGRPLGRPALGSVDRAVDRTKRQPACTYPCTSVDPYGRPATWYGRPSGSTGLAWHRLFWAEKLSYLISNKFP